MKRILRSIRFVAVVVCAAWVCMNLWGTKVSTLYAEQTLLAWMEETQDSVNYGAGPADSASNSSSDEEELGQSGLQNTQGYIQYQAGPTQAQVEDPRRQEQEKEAASLNMMQNLFIGLDARPGRGPFEDGQVK